MAINSGGGYSNRPIGSPKNTASFGREKVPGDDPLEFGCPAQFDP